MVTKVNIAITGVSGKYPESNNIEQLSMNLFNKTDMVNDTNSRYWPKSMFGSPEGSGKLKNLDKFDSKFFKLNKITSESMDVQIRIMLEVIYEAIWDSGNDPEMFSQIKTGLYIGQCFNDHFKAFNSIGSLPEESQYISQMVSYIYNFTGPSFTVDSACASSLSALHEAVIALQHNLCDAAIVVGVNLPFDPFTQWGFYDINMLSIDGKCKCLDESANGYARGEACVAIVLQKESVAKRIYATLVNVKSNNNGYGEMGITYPSWKKQSDLIEATYSEANICRSDIQYIEAHCTGTQAGDQEEMKAIYQTMCSDDRQYQLLIGALKSSIGHTEGASGVCALSKVIISLENECIPANIHYNKPNPNIEGLVKGLLKPITENTPFFGELVAINNFGFGGTNVHLIIKSPKIRKSIDNNIIIDRIPRLINICGRDESSVNYFFEALLKKSDKITKDLLSLINDISKTSAFPSNIGYSGMTARGYALISNSGEKLKSFNTREISERDRQVWYVLPGLGSQYSAMAKDLIQINIFETSIRNSCEIMKKFSIDLLDLLLNEKQNFNESLIKSSLALTAIQIALIDLLSELNIKANGMIGHSNGELLCAYADGCISAEETIDLVYWRMTCVATGGSMAAIGVGIKDAKDMCPTNVFIACDNSDNSVTVSGDKISIDEFVKSLKSQKILATIVQSCGQAFHSPLMYSIEEQLKEWLKRILPECRKKSKCWISTQTLNECTNICADYFVDNLLYPCYFNEAVKQIPRNAIIVEVSPHCMFQSIIRSNLGSNIAYIPLMKKNANNLIQILLSFGTLYTLGLNPMIEKLYPKVVYPVSSGTSILSPLIKWNHSDNFVVTKYPEFFKILNRNIKLRISLMVDENKFLGNHIIDGKCMLPATYYLYIIWKQLANLHNIQLNYFAVEYNNIDFHRTTLIDLSDEIVFTLNIDIISCKFELSESGSLVVTGCIKRLNKFREFETNNILYEKSFEKQLNGSIVLNKKYIYKELGLRGYNFGPYFQCIREGYFDNRVFKSLIDWSDNWVSFLDSMFQMATIAMNSKQLCIPVRIDKLQIEPQLLLSAVKSRGNNSFLEAVFHTDLGVCVANGVQYNGLKLQSIQRNLNSQKLFIGFYRFEYYINRKFVYNNQNDLLEYSKCCNEMALEILEKFDLSSIGFIRNVAPVKEPIVNRAVKLIKVLESKYETVLGQLLSHVCQLTEQTLIDSLIDLNGERLLATDMICNAFNRNQLIDPLLAAVFENTSTEYMNILEINATNALLYTEFRNTFDTYDYNTLIDYTLIHPFPNQLLDILPNSIIVKEWDTTTHSVFNSLPEFQIIVYKDLSICPQSVIKKNIELKQLFQLIYNKLISNGFLLIVCREELTFAEQIVCKLLNLKQINTKKHDIIAEAEKSNFTFIGIYADVFSVNALLFRKVTADIVIGKQCFIDITDKFDDWVPKLQTELKSINSKPEGQNIWLMSKSDPISGILGFYNCIRKEPNGNRIRIIFNSNKISNENKSIDNIEIESIVRNDLKINIIKGNKLGYFKMTTMNAMGEPVLSEHCCLNIGTKGNLSSLQWFECQHKFWPNIRKGNENFCHIYYSSLNFRDIMLSTGRLSMDAIPANSDLQESLFGLEFSGRDENGNRVMAMIPSKALATTCIVKTPDFLWTIPEHWSMEEAATVPCVYATAYYALIIRGKLRRNEKVLIHSGSGGVGQAAIRICLSLDCQLFITVGSDEKQDYLKVLFPTLTDCDFYSSHDISFKTKIMKRTNGSGVDVILNSLSEEKLKASLECLATNGRFLEIGKYDMSINKGLDITDLVNNKVFHGILLDSLFTIDENSKNKCLKERKQIRQLIKDGIKAGVVKPLDRTIFSIDKCEDAFRFMASGRHKGKVVIKIREEERQHICGSVTKTEILAIPRTVFFENKTYIITGGLGGMGLELIDWMIERGAKKFVITSRTGPKDGYQNIKLKSYTNKSAFVLISNEDLSTLTGAENLIHKARVCAPIGGIFHLQGVIRDGLFENQSTDSFNDVCVPKSEALKNLDLVSRKLCPNIDYFVAYSSLTSSRGGAGQSNYGFSNSVMDRICDLRRADGLPALAIQWGLVGDVGMSTINESEELEFIGSKPQPMYSCLNSLDRILQSKHSICICFARSQPRFERISEQKMDLMKTVANILGLDDYTKLDSNTKLVTLGLDSIMTIEVKQMIERQLNAVVTTEYIRDLSIAMVQEIRCDHNLNISNNQ